jgi:hypothetical protein
LMWKITPVRAETTVSQTICPKPGSIYASIIFCCPSDGSFLDYDFSTCKIKQQFICHVLVGNIKTQTR